MTTAEGGFTDNLVKPSKCERQLNVAGQDTRVLTDFKKSNDVKDTPLPNLEEMYNGRIRRMLKNH